MACFPITQSFLPHQFLFNLIQGTLFSPALNVSFTAFSLPNPLLPSPPASFTSSNPTSAQTLFATRATQFDNIFRAEFLVTASVGSHSILVLDKGPDTVPKVLFIPQMPKLDLKLFAKHVRSLKQCRETAQDIVNTKFRNLYPDCSFSFIGLFKSFMFYLTSTRKMVFYVESTSIQ